MNVGRIIKLTNLRGRRLNYTVVIALICIAVLGVSVVSALTSNSTGTHNGYYYSFWKDSGDASFDLLEGGRYKSQWTNSTNNWVGGKGWNPGGPKVVNYSGSYNVDNSQNSYLALYGWTRNPLIEYYVVESYGSYNPASCSGGTDYGSFQSDGATYNVRRCQRVQQPSIDGTQTFYQYFSVRTPKKGFGNVSGTITVANHFNYWASKGLNLGSHDYMVLATEGYQSSGSSDITVSEGTVPQPTSTPISNPTSTPGGGNIVVRARGTAGGEHINLRVGGSVVANWTLTTSNQNYTYNGNASGDIQVQFDNDASGRDVILDYIVVNGNTRQAENMEYNTATYGNSQCGGGSYSETMHCNGVIGFGNTGISPTAVPPTATSVPPTTTSVPPTVTSVPPTATSQPGATCSVKYVISNDWGSGFTADVKITNTGSSTLNGWTVTYAFPGNQTITNAWNATVTQSGKNITAKDAGWNGTLAPNGSANFGFQASYSGSNTTPIVFKVNGSTCN